MKNLVVSSLLLSCILVSANVHASLIAVFGDRAEKLDLSTNLRNLGHTVVDLGVDFIAPLEQYDSVWGVHAANDTISAIERDFLTSFINAGGGVYLTGERPCCEALNDSVSDVVNDVVIGGGIQIGGLGEQGSNVTINQNVVGNLANSPNLVNTFTVLGAGGISGLLAENILATSDSQTAIAAAFDSHNLVNDAGRLVVVQDVDWLNSDNNDDNLAFLENVEVFLSSAKQANNVPEPSVLAMLGLGLIGMTSLRKRRHA